MQTINDRIGIVLKETGKTKTAFAESLKVSQQYISKLIKTGNPSDLLIEDICQKYNIDENWLRNGVGSMTIHRNKNQIISEFAADLIKEPTSFKTRLFEAMAKLDERDWITIEKIFDKMNRM